MGRAETSSGSPSATTTIDHDATDIQQGAMPITCCMCIINVVRLSLDAYRPVCLSSIDGGWFQILDWELDW